MASNGPFGGDLFGDGGEEESAMLGQPRGRPNRAPPVPDQQQERGTEYQSIGMEKGACGREYRTVDPERGPCEPSAKIACCKANFPNDEDYAKFKELMMMQCDGKKLSECQYKTLRELRYKFGTMAWGFNPTGWSYEAGRVLNRGGLKDNSTFFGKEVIGSFFFLMIFVWTTAGFAANVPSGVTVIDSTNVGLEDALNSLISYQYSRDLLSQQYWAYVGAIFASVFLTHLLWVTAYIEGVLAVMLWFFSDDGMLTARKPRFSVLLSSLLGQMAGFALCGALTLAAWEHKDPAFDSLLFEPSVNYTPAVSWMFENTGCFIIALGWIASLIMPRTLIKQFHSFQVVVPVLITAFHAVAKALTIHTTVGSLGIWTYLTVSLFLTGFGSSAWIYIVAPITGMLMAAIVWFFTTRYIYSYGGNKRNGVVFRLNF